MTYLDQETACMKIIPGRLYRCNVCVFSFVWPRTARAIDNSYFAEHRKHFKTTSHEDLEKRFSSIVHEIEMHSHRSKGSLLDVGCGKGLFLLHMKQKGWDVTGIEPVKESADHARTLGLNIINVVLEHAKLPQEHFDVVHLSHVLEHVADPVGCMLRVSGLLKKRGLVVIEVPHEFGPLTMKIRKAFHALPQFPMPSAHVSFFTPATLKEVIKRSRLTVVSLKTFHESTSIRDFLKLHRLFDYAFHTGPRIRAYALKG